jgi:hypothetical protein
MSLFLGMLRRFGILRRLVSGFINTGLSLFLFSLLLILPSRIKYVLEKFGHSFFKGIIIYVGGIDKIVDHLHYDIIVYSGLPILIIVGIMRKIVILNGICVVLLI